MVTEGTDMDSRTNRGLREGRSRGVFNVDSALNCGSLWNLCIHDALARYRDTFLSPSGVCVSCLILTFLQLRSLFTTYET